MSAKKIVFVADPLSSEALDVFSAEASIEVDNRPGLPADEKLAALSRAHGLIVRSQTKVTAEFLDAAEHLELIVRAGVGVDNIDVPAATRKGIVVQNIPEGNTRSAAEHAVALLLALARNVQQAGASLQDSKWERKLFVGTELQGKTLGIVGLGKIGRHVLHMAQGLGMKTIAFDPFVSPQLVEQAGVETATSLEDLVGRVDFLTLHVPKSAETMGLVSKSVFQKCRRGIFLVNCARGGIVDEAALLEALEDGTVAGAALDVFAKEPPEDFALIRHPRVVATPHLGASTREAQLNVAIAAAQQMVAYFVHGKLTSPINTLALEPEALSGVEPYTELCYRLGLLQAQLLEGNPVRVRIQFLGDIFDSELRRYLTASVLRGFLRNHCSQPVNLVNAHHLAQDMGLAVEEVSEGKSRYFHQMVRVEVTDASGRRDLGGTIRGQRGLRVVSLDDYQFDSVLEGSILMIQNEDRPGMIGVIGNLLSAHRVNISYMSLGRDRSGGRAIALMNLDDPVPPEIAENLTETDGILWARLVHLPS